MDCSGVAVLLLLHGEEEVAVAAEVAAEVAVGGVLVETKVSGLLLFLMELAVFNRTRCRIIASLLLLLGVVEGGAEGEATATAAVAGTSLSSSLSLVVELSHDVSNSPISCSFSSCDSCSSIKP